MHEVGATILENVFELNPLSGGVGFSAARFRSGAATEVVTGGTEELFQLLREPHATGLLR